MEGAQSLEPLTHEGNATSIRLPRAARASSRRGRRALGIIGLGDTAVESASVLCGDVAGAGPCTLLVDMHHPSRVALKTMLPVSGPLADLSRADLLDAADEYVLAFAPDDALHAVNATQRLIRDGVDFRVMPESMGCVYHVLRDLGWAEMPVVPITQGGWAALARAWKRTTDIVIAAAVLLLLLPLMVIVALLIGLESPGSSIFRQDRVGKNGRVFRILKFRTMVAGAQGAETCLAADCSVDPRFVKIECDPRVTWLGRILRRTSVDELPQLWNVLRGEMSLVGPRPSQPSEVEHYAPEHFTRLLVKPGVTGLWQVSGRSNLCFEEAVKLDSLT